MVRKTSLVLDTNIVISALVFGGKPADVLKLVRDKKVRGTTSPVLLAEIEEILAKKFDYGTERLKQVMAKLRKTFYVVQPSYVLGVVRDIDDNRVLEAAVTGKCDFIITGDKDLLVLKRYKNIQILTATRFLEEVWKV